MVRWLSITLGLVALPCANVLAQSPTMTISWSSSSGDYNPAHPGSELRISFYIDNTSAPGVINSMINFSLPAGITQGIYAVSLDEAFLGLAENAYRRLDST